MRDQFSLGLTGSLLVMAAVTQPFFVANAASSGALPATLDNASYASGNEGANAVVSPVSTAYNSTYAELGEEWWRWALTLPAELSNPYVTKDCNSQGKTQSGKVWFLFGTGGEGNLAGTPLTTLYCAIPPNRTLFFPIINGECSDGEAPPYYGANEPARRACARAWNDDVRDMKVTVDGVSIPNLQAYRTPTPDIRLKLPAGNIFGLPKNTVIESAGDGYYLRLAPLSPGPHVIHMEATQHLVGTTTQFSVNSTWMLFVGNTGNSE
jgi:hypothetical protein